MFSLVWMGCETIDVTRGWLQLHHVTETLGLQPHSDLLCDHFSYADGVCMQENLFKQGQAGISPQCDRTNHFSSPVSSAAGMTQVEVQIGIRTDTMTEIRTMDTEVAAVSTVTRIMMEMVRELGKTAGHIESIGILPI